MKWYDGRPQLRMTGCRRTAEEIIRVFDSCMVDVAYVLEVTAEATFIVADDPAWPKDQADYDWLCDIIQKTLGTNSLEFTLLPAAEAHDRSTLK